MPTHDYKCAHCGAVHTIYVAPAPEIPSVMRLQCVDYEGGPNMCDYTRQLSAPAVVIPAKHRAA